MAESPRDDFGGCCHPVDGHHWPGEPSTCCHVHVEDLPSNAGGDLGEPIEPPPGWTAQGQFLYNQWRQQNQQQDTAND